MFLGLQMFRDCNDLLWECVSESESECACVMSENEWVYVCVCVNMFANEEMEEGDEWKMNESIGNIFLNQWPTSRLEAK